MDYWSIAQLPWQRRWWGRLGRAIALLTVTLFTITTFTPTSYAEAGPSPSPITDATAGQTTEQSALLIGPRADAPIPLYLRPAANQPNVGYGRAGDTVTVLEQIASFLPEADAQAAWNHIRLDQAPYTEGWVQGRFLITQPSN